MRTTADVVVIGGGVMGCSILFNLARLGITNTVLLEKDILNGGSTGRSQSICRMHYSNPVTATMAWESLQVFTNFEDIVGGPSGFTETGYLVVVKEEDRPGLQHNCAMQVGLGIDTMVVNAADLAEIAPMVSVTEDEALGWEPQSGYADPYLVTSSYANAARRMGAEINLGVPSTGVELADGLVHAVNTPQGRIETPAVVVAAGPWSKAELAACRRRCAPRDRTASGGVTGPAGGPAATASRRRRHRPVLFLPSRWAPHDAHGLWR